MLAGHAMSEDGDSIPLQAWARHGDSTQAGGMGTVLMLAGGMGHRGMGTVLMLAGGMGHMKTGTVYLCGWQTDRTAAASDGSDHGRRRRMDRTVPGHGTGMKTGTVYLCGWQTDRTAAASDGSDHGRRRRMDRTVPGHGTGMGTVLMLAGHAMSYGAKKCHSMTRVWPPGMGTAKMGTVYLCGWQTDRTAAASDERRRKMGTVYLCGWQTDRTAAASDERRRDSTHVGRPCHVIRGQKVPINDTSVAVALRCRGIVSCCGLLAPGLSPYGGDDGTIPGVLARFGGGFGGRMGRPERLG